jgi:hypothetical protein
MTSQLAATVERGLEIRTASRRQGSGRGEEERCGDERENRRNSARDESARPLHARDRTRPSPVLFSSGLRDFVVETTEHEIFKIQNTSEHEV